MTSDWLHTSLSSLVNGKETSGMLPVFHSVYHIILDMCFHGRVKYLYYFQKMSFLAASIEEKIRCSAVFTLKRGY